MAKKKTRAARKPTTSAKKPSWDLVTFQDLDSWRAKHSVPKKKLAHFLGVTNSTWHNWQGGRSNASLATQQRIKELVSGEPPMALMNGGLKKPNRTARGGRRRGKSAESPIGVGVASEDQRLNAVAAIVTAALTGNPALAASRGDVTGLIDEVRASLQ